MAERSGLTAEERARLAVLLERQLALPLEERLPAHVVRDADGRAVGTAYAYSAEEEELRQLARRDQEERGRAFRRAID